VTVNLVVAVLVGLAWIFISTRPETDFTHGEGGEPSGWDTAKPTFKSKKR